VAFDYLSGTESILQNVFARHAQSDGAKTWCVSEGKDYSYAEIDQDANRVADGLKNEFGILKGDAVAVCMHNRAQFFIAMFAILRLGAVYVPCSTLYSADELRYQLDHADVKALFTDDAMLPLVLESLPSEELRRHIVLCGTDTSHEHVGFETFLDGRSTEMPIESQLVTADDLAMIMYTSGTTARPKGVMYSHGNMTTLAQTQAQYLGWTSEDRYLHYFPLYHGNGGLMGVVPAIWRGATLVMIPKFSASNFSRQLVENDVTFVPVNATNAKMILNNPETEFDSTHRVRRMMLGLTLTTDELQAFEARFNTRLISTYGLTESLTAMVISELSGLNPAGSAGRVVRGYSVKVVGDEGESVAPGEVGEAVIFSHQRHGLAMGYFKDAPKTEEVFVDGWLYSGDFIRIDEDGYVWYAGRKKDMIKRSGFNVAPAEIERVIREIPGVTDVAVVGCPDAVREEAIVAFVVTNAPLSSDEVIAACVKDLAHYKVPQFAEFLSELPCNFLGKVDRIELRRLAMKFEVISTERS